MEGLEGGKGSPLKFLLGGRKGVLFQLGEYELPVVPLNLSPLYGKNLSLALRSHSSFRLGHFRDSTWSNQLVVPNCEFKTDFISNTEVSQDRRGSTTTKHSIKKRLEESICKCHDKWKLHCFAMIEQNKKAFY